MTNHTVLWRLLNLLFRSTLSSSRSEGRSTTNEGGLFGETGKRYSNYARWVHDASL